MKRLKLFILIFGILILLFVGIFAGVYFFSEKEIVCGDGTLNNECSLLEPYFCLDGKLVEMASVCGCSNVSEVEGDKCISEFQTGEKNVSLGYVLRGKDFNFDFVVYEGLYNYLGKLPRYIDSTDGDVDGIALREKMIEDEIQKEFLKPLLAEIFNSVSSKEDQMRVAVSLVQNLPFGRSNKTLNIFGNILEYQRYPYETLYDFEGICSEKSLLLIFLLKEIGYDSAALYYQNENHEAVGIKCPEKFGVDGLSYCFVETTGHSIISDDKNDFVSGFVLESVPEVFQLSEGISLPKNLYEYSDAKSLIQIREKMKKEGSINIFEVWKFKSLKEKYGFVDFGKYTF